MVAPARASDELFYGGAAGGGKTDLELGLACATHRSSVIFRREYPRLDAIVERSQQVIGDKEQYYYPAICSFRVWSAIRKS